MLVRLALVVVALCALVIGGGSVRAQTMTSPGCYNITSTAVTFTYSGCASPTPAPTPVPTPTPTPNPGTFQGFVNGQPYPAGFAPFPTSPVWSSPLPTITPGYYTTDSATIVAEQWAQNASSSGQALHNDEPGNFDTSFPVYVSTPSDPLIALVNPVLGVAQNTTGGIPATVNIPQVARPGQSLGLVSNFTIFQPAGSEVDLSVLANGNPATMNPPGSHWPSGGTMQQASVGDTCSNFYTGTGMGTGAVSTTPAGQCDAAGLVGINDLLRGTISHALAVYVNCTVTGAAFPAQFSGTQTCTDGVGPQMGYRMWYDVPCATTQAISTMPNPTKAILCALNVYGGYVVGTLWGGTIGVGAGLNSGQFGFTIGLESSEPFYAYGNGDKFAALFAQGWVGTTVPGYASGFQRWYARPQDASGNWAPSGVNFASHIHYIKSCVTQQAC